MDSVSNDVKLDVKQVFWNKLKELKYEVSYTYALQRHYEKWRNIWSIILAIVTGSAFMSVMGTSVPPLLAVGVSFIANCLAIALPYFQHGIKVEAIGTSCHGLQRVYDEAELFWMVEASRQWSDERALAKWQYLVSQERFFLDVLQNLGVPHNKKASLLARKEANDHIEYLGKMFTP